MLDATLKGETSGHLVVVHVVYLIISPKPSLYNVHSCQVQQAHPLKTAQPYRDCREGLDLKGPDPDLKAQTRTKGLDPKGSDPDLKAQTRTSTSLSLKHIRPVAEYKTIETYIYQS